VLSRAQKVAYGLADVAGATSYNAINFHLLFFLVSALRLNPALAGAVLLIGRVIDAVTDPLMGVISDQVKARGGSRLRLVRIFMLPFAITFALIWWLPPLAVGASPGVSSVSSSWLLFAAAAGLLTLHTSIFTVLQVSYLAMTPDLAPDYHARTALTSYRVAFSTVAALLAAALPPLLVAAFMPVTETITTINTRGWQVMGTAFAVVMVVCFVPFVLTVSEPHNDFHKGDGNSQDSQKRWDFSDILKGFTGTLQGLMQVRGYARVTTIFILATLGNGTLSSMLPFYLDSVLGFSGEQATLSLGLVFIAAASSMPLWTGLAKTYGKSTSLALGAVVTAVSLLAIAFLPLPAGLSVALVVLALITGLGLGAILLFPWAMLPDVVSDDALRSGREQSGTLYAFFTFAQKTAFAVGAFVNGQVLALTGFDAEAVTQGARATNGITLMVGLVAAGCFFLTAWAAKQYAEPRA
jgi:GPH family glycoside/pentoside/hexuronide:cation symporter